MSRFHKPCTLYAAAVLFAMGGALSSSAFAAASAGGAGAGKTSKSDFGNFSGDGNWFNPANWSTGRVPGADSNVELRGSVHAVIDPALDPTGYGRLVIKDVLISGVAELEVLPGAVLESRTQVLGDRGQIVFRASGDAGGDLIVAGTTDTNPCTGCGLKLNPSPKSKRIIVLSSSATVDMGLGGTTPAGLARDATGDYQLAAGRGHYATMTADTMVLDGDLKLSTYYGFEPRPGDAYQIMTIKGRRSGEFIGIPEGGYVGCTDGNVGLRLSYEGGDGNDVVVSAEQTEPGICLLLPAVQKVREAAARINARVDRLPGALGAAVGEGVAQTREHILLARQVGLFAPTNPASAASCDAQTSEIGKAACECKQQSGGMSLSACIAAKLPTPQAATRQNFHRLFGDSNGD